MNTTKIKDLQALFTDRGYNPVIGTIYQQQEYWLSWYRGDVDGFHSIQKKNAEGRLLSIQKPSLQMAKKVGEDLVSLLFNENVRLIVNNAKAQKVLDNVLEKTAFYEEMPNFLELVAVPYGTGAAIEHTSDDETKISYVFGDRLYVIDYENTKITAIAVVNEFVKNKMKYTHVMYHTVNETYQVRHEMYATKERNQGIGDPTSLLVLFSEAELQAMRREVQVDENTVEIQYIQEYETTDAHFQVFKFPISNNYDVRSPMGISVIANAVGTLENIDEKYYSSRMDSINSRKRVFVDEGATKMVKTKDENGNVKYVKYFDQDETQYQPLKDMGSGGKYVETYAPQYDSAQHDSAIQAELDYLSSKVMLGRNYYSFKDGTVGYQNELNVIASNSDTYRNRQKILNRLSRFLIGMMKAILYLEQENGNYTGKLDLEYSVQFDDDIMTDDETKLQRLRLDAQDGFIPEYMYVMEAYGLSEKEAIALLEKAEGYEEPDVNEDDVDGEE